jgi:hypothetical protein
MLDPEPGQGVSEESKEEALHMTVVEGLSSEDLLGQILDTWQRPGR